MNCQQVEQLLSRERDQRLPVEAQAALETHVAGCADCQRLRSELEAAVAAWRASAARIQTPDTEVEWLRLQAQLTNERPTERARVERSTGWAWWAVGVPAALAAGLAIFFMRAGTEAVGRPEGMVARADFVELGDDTATPIVYVDDASGWLIVWSEVAPKVGGRG